MRGAGGQGLLRLSRAFQIMNADERAAATHSAAPHAAEGFTADAMVNWQQVPSSSEDSADFQRIVNRLRVCLCFVRECIDLQHECKVVLLLFRGSGRGSLRILRNILSGYS